MTNQSRLVKSGPGSQKVEPTSRAVNPAGVAQIGSAMGNHATESGKIMYGVSKPLYAGRGFEAPKVSCEPHKGGSQGKY